jgi:hypothetical protein
MTARLREENRDDRAAAPGRTQMSARVREEEPG